MPIKGLALDLDGVLVDACELHRVALNDALRYCGKPEISLEDHKKTYNGLPTLKKLGILGYSDAEARHIAGEKQRLTIDTMKKTIFPNPRMVALVQQLSRKYPLVCTSNSVRPSVEGLLERTGIREFFQHLISNEDVKCPKPHPEMYIEACRRLELAPREVLAVEDSSAGQRAVISAGVCLCPVINPDDLTWERIHLCIRAHEAAERFE